MEVFENTKINDVIEYEDKTPYEIYEKSNAVSMTYYANANFTKAVEISKEFLI